MCLKEKKLLQKFAATLKKFSAQGAKKVDYGSRKLLGSEPSFRLRHDPLHAFKEGGKVASHDWVDHRILAFLSAIGF